MEDTKDVGFDLEEWKKKGEEAYRALEDRIKGIDAHIQELQRQKTSVEAEKAHLGQTLGIEKRGEVSKRVRIRPRVLEILKDCGDQTRDEVFEKLKETIPRVKRSSFDEAIRRMLNSEEVSLWECEGNLTIINEN